MPRTPANGADRLALDRCLNLAHGRIGLFEVRRCLVEIGLRADALFGSNPGARERKLRDRAVPRRLPAARVLFRVEAHEDLTLAYRLSGCEIDLRHEARQIGADRHTIDRDHGADAFRVVFHRSCVATIVVTASGGG